MTPLDQFKALIAEVGVVKAAARLDVSRSLIWMTLRRGRVGRSIHLALQCPGEHADDRRGTFEARQARRRDAILAEIRRRHAETGQSVGTVSLVRACGGCTKLVRETLRELEAEGLVRPEFPGRPCAGRWLPAGLRGVLGPVPAGEEVVQHER